MWPEDGRRYLGRIEATHGDIGSGFPYDVAFCDGDKEYDLAQVRVRAIRDEVRCISQMQFLERHVSY